MKLTKEQFETFEEISSSYGDVRTDYSGRGMYGKNCIGIDGDGNQLKVVAKLFVELAETELASIIDKLAARISSDNMGLGWIIYFPGVQYDGEIEGQDEEDYE